MKKTPWFPGDVKPARPGIYERKCPDGTTVFSNFKKANWMVGATTINKADTQTYKSLNQRLKWRGLVEKS